jgi:hypothetical protein
VAEYQCGQLVLVQLLFCYTPYVSERKEPDQEYRDKQSGQPQALQEKLPREMLALQISQMLDKANYQSLHAANTPQAQE